MHVHFEELNLRRLPGNYVQLLDHREEERREFYRFEDLREHGTKFVRVAISSQIQTWEAQPFVVKLSNIKLYWAWHNLKKLGAPGGMKLATGSRSLC